MSDRIETKALNKISDAIDITIPENLDDEQEMIAIIELRVNQLLEGDIDLLMSYLYRLDVLESKIKSLLNNQDVISAPRGLAELIFQRQKERILTKEKYKQNPIDGWDSW